MQNFLDAELVGLAELKTRLFMQLCKKVYSAYNRADVVRGP